MAVLVVVESAFSITLTRSALFSSNNVPFGSAIAKLLRLDSHFIFTPTHLPPLFEPDFPEREREPSAP